MKILMTILAALSLASAQTLVEDYATTMADHMGAIEIPCPVGVLEDFEGRGCYEVASYYDAMLFRSSWDLYGGMNFVGVTPTGPWERTSAGVIRVFLLEETIIVVGFLTDGGGYLIGWRNP